MFFLTVTKLTQLMTSRGDKITEKYSQHGIEKTIIALNN